MPKKDFFTNTIKDAAEFEAYWNSEPPDHFDESYDEYDYYDEDDPNYDSCKCSDPCCPCTGSKIGIP